MSTNNYMVTRSQKILTLLNLPHYETTRGLDEDLKSQAVTNFKGGVSANNLQTSRRPSSDVINDVPHTEVNFDVTDSARYTEVNYDISNSAPCTEVNFDDESVVFETSGSEYFPSDIEADEEEPLCNKKKKHSSKSNLHDTGVEEKTTDSTKKQQIPNKDIENKVVASETENEPITHTDEMQDHSSHAVHIRVSSKTEDGRRKRDKVYCCLYCNKLLQELSKHLLRKHSDELEIQKLMAKSKGDPTRRQGFIHLGNVGNYYHNCEVLKQKRGELLLARLPTPEEAKCHTYKDYGPCPDCLAFMLKRHLWHHLKLNCEAKENRENVVARRKPIFESNMLLMHTFSEIIPSLDFGKYILSVLKDDNISLICRQDQLIVKFGEIQFEKYHTTQSELIRQSMRQLARLVCELRKVDAPKVWLSQWLNPVTFDTIVSAVKNICKVQCSVKSRPQFNTPSLALKIGHHLRKCVAIEKAQCLRKNDSNAIQILNNFLNLMDIEWTSRISSNALRTLLDRKLNAVELLPLTDDLVKLNKYLNNKLSEYKALLMETRTYQNWGNLAAIVLCKITLFNKRRSGEISRITVLNYSSRPNWHQQGTSEFQNTFTDLEQKLANRLTIVQIKGKRGSTVNVLVTDDVKESVDLLIKYRSDFVSKENPYLFARSSPSTDYIRGHDCLRKFANEADLAQPELIKSTKLRKYIATVSQIFNLSEKETDWLARHLGHDIRIHRQFYRLHESSIELTKISRILLAVENGQANKFKGKTLDEINISDLPELEAEEEEDVVEEDNAQNKEMVEEYSNDMQTEECSEDMLTDETPNEHEKEKGSKKEQRNNKNKKKKQILRRPWNDGEIKAVLNFFRNSIKKGITPGKAQCSECIEINQVLRNRTWKDVKYFVYNYHKKINKRR